MEEASYIIKKSEDDFVDKWDQTRYIAYAIIQSQSTKKLTPSDILTFPWEKKDSGESPPVKSKEDLIKHALDMENKLNNNVS